MRRLLFIFKNRQALFWILSFFQVMLNVWPAYLSEHHHLINLFSFSLLPPVIRSFLFAFFIALINEVFARFLAYKTKKFALLNNLILFFTYTIAKCGSYIARLVGFGPDRITLNSELDIIRYVKNLTMDNIVEKKEAQLVQAAFNFDDLTMEFIMTPIIKTVFLRKNMSYKEVKRIYFKNLFFYYPVLNERNKMCGVFNAKKFCMSQKRKKWQSQINKSFLCFSYFQTLDKLLDSVEKDELTLAAVFKNKKMVGIITHKDVFDALIGNWKRKKNPDDILNES